LGGHLVTPAREGISQPVITGLVPVIHVFLYYASKTWMAGTNPAMTIFMITP
jgi:hypothetical protein